MPSREEYIALLQVESEKAAKSASEQGRLQIAVSDALRELKIADPKWLLYAQHLEALSEVASSRADDVKRRLVGPKWLTESETGQLRLEAASEGARAEALRLAVSFIEELIQKGKPEEET